MSAQASINRLAALLDVSPDRLTPLSALRAAELEALTVQISDRLHAEDASRLGPLFAIIDRVPAALSARLAESTLAPRLVARVAPHLDEAVGTRLIERLSASYLAKVAVWLEHARCSRLLAAIEPAQIAETARCLAAGRRWSTMAAVSAELPDASLAAALGALSDRAIARTMAVGDPATNRRALAAMDRARCERVQRQVVPQPDSVAA